MPMINFSAPLPLLVALVLFVLVLWFARQSKKSIITGIMLFTFLIMLVGHTIEFAIGNLTDTGTTVVINSIIFDLIFIFLSFISYLWVDDIEAKTFGKKSVDNTLDWFWKKI